MEENPIQKWFNLLLSPDADNQEIAFVMAENNTIECDDVQSIVKSRFKRGFEDTYTDYGIYNVFITLIMQNGVKPYSYDEPTGKWSEVAHEAAHRFDNLLQKKCIEIRGTYENFLLALERPSVKRKRKLYSKRCQAEREYRTIVGAWAYSNFDEHWTTWMSSKNK